MLYRDIGIDINKIDVYSFCISQVQVREIKVLSKPFPLLLTDTSVVFKPLNSQWVAILFCACRTGMVSPQSGPCDHNVASSQPV